MSCRNRYRDRTESRPRDPRSRDPRPNASLHWSRNPWRLYRDPDNGRIAGVCAGLSHYLDIPVRFIRIGLIVAMVMGFFLPVVAVYVLMAIFLKPLPDPLFESPQEESFWRGVAFSPNRTAEDLRKRFRRLDRRLAEMERQVTSEEFDLRRQFRDLGA